MLAAIYIYSRSQSTENHDPQSRRLLFQNTSTIASSVSAGAPASGVFGVPLPGTVLRVVNKISAAAVSRDTLQRCRTHAVISESRPNRRQSTRKWRKKTHRNSLQVVFVFVLGKILYSSHLSLLAQTHKKQENSSFVSLAASAFWLLRPPPLPVLCHRALASPPLLCTCADSSPSVLLATSRSVNEKRETREAD